jgi:hypothetical protein
MVQAAFVRLGLRKELFAFGIIGGELGELLAQGASLRAIRAR